MGAPFDPQMLVLRPTWPFAHLLGRQRPMRFGLPLVGLCVTALVVVLAWDSVAHSLLYWLIVLIPLIGLATSLYAMRQYDGSRIVVAAGTITLEKWLEQPKPVPIQDISRIVLCRIEQEVSQALPPPAALFFGRDGRCLLSFYAARWAKGDLDVLWRRIGIVPEGSWGNTISYLDLNNVFPHAFDRPAA
jgi:hypothetical protein